MQHKIFLQILFFLSLLQFCNISQATGVTQGAMLSNSCSACHGTDGKSPGSIPGINGKSADFISQALTEFRDGNRKSTVMGRHAKGYTDQEIKLIADHFSNL